MRPRLLHTLIVIVTLLTALRKLLLHAGIGQHQYGLQSRVQGSSDFNWRIHDRKIRNSNFYRLWHGATEGL
jgi:hypothetical protein